MLNKPLYNTKTFTEVFPSEKEFIDFYKNNGIRATIKEENAKLLYYMLFAKYGNTPIANLDEYQFKMKAMTIIFQFGPSWETRLRIQERFRELNEEELRVGSKIIYNRSFNPSDEPATSTLEELATINEQTSNNNKKSILEAYATLDEVVRMDVTESFIYKFRVLFKQFVMPENPILYVEEEED